MLTFDLSLKKNYRIEAENLEEAIKKLKQFAEENDEIRLNKDFPSTITDTHGNTELLELQSRFEE